jgi:hypothetical protein
MIVSYEFVVAVRDCYVTTEEPPFTPETLLMARHGTYWIVLDPWSNLAWFVREADAQGCMRKLREEVRSVGDQTDQD